MKPTQDILTHPISLDQSSMLGAESVPEVDASSRNADEYNLSYFSVNALRYITGYRECPDCDYTTRLDHFDPRLILIHGDYAHLKLTIGEMRQHIAGR